MLELRNITKRFGHVVANDQVSLTVKAGTVHAIVGENGAGKSTAMKIAYGFYTPDSGNILIDGTEHIFSSTHDAIRLGIGMVHQHFMLIDSMSVTENIVLGEEPGNAIALDLKSAKNKIQALSNEFNLLVDTEELVGSLSVGQQQRVELLKALYHQTRLLILDEPTAVLTPQEVKELFNILERMRNQGKTIILITHKLPEVMAISNEVTVMRDGRVVGQLKTESTNESELARLMVGREVLLRAKKTSSNPGSVILKVKDLSVKPSRLNNISFEIRSGEILGIAGIEGNGQTELIETLAGLTPKPLTTGTVEFEGRDITTTNARKRKQMGIAHVPEDRHKRGLLLDFNLEENVILGMHYLEPVTSYRGTLLNKKFISRYTQEIIKAFDVRPANPDLPVRTLSGGNQQKLMIGREFSLKPKLLLIAQPTRGVDIGAIEFIHQKLFDLRNSGCAVLLVSADLEELLTLSDKLLVLYQGSIVGETDPESTNIETIGLLMTRGRL